MQPKQGVAVAGDSEVRDLPGDGFEIVDERADIVIPRWRHRLAPRKDSKSRRFQATPRFIQAPRRPPHIDRDAEPVAYWLLAWPINLLGDEMTARPQDAEDLIRTIRLVAVNDEI